MPQFEQTQTAISEYYANRQQAVGGHIYAMPRAGARGLIIGEVPFEGAVHPAHAMKPFSIHEEITGLPQVDLTLPHRALEIQVILDRSPSRDIPRIQKAKRALMDLLVGAIFDSRPDMTDRVREVVIVDQDSEEAKTFGPDVEKINSQEGPEAVASRVASICVSGLTLVLSNFEALRLDQLPSRNFQSTVGVKVNHFSSIKLPKGNVKIPVGNGRMIDASDEVQLAAYHRVQDTHNKAVVDRLSAVDIAVSQVVLYPGLALGFDYEESDKSIASAIQHVGNRN